MKVKQAMTGLLSGLFLFGMVSQAQALVINISEELAGGGTLIGTVTTIDPAGPPWVIDWNLTASGGLDPRGNVIPTFIYNPTSSTTDINNRNRTRFLANIPPVGNIRRLDLRWDPNLNRPVPAFGRGVERYAFVRNPNNGRIGTRNRQVTPEPATILLFGTGLLGLGLLRYRKNAKI